MYLGRECIWAEIRDIASSLSYEGDDEVGFVWETESELRWIEQVWNGLAKQGLTRYENESEKMLVQGQLGTIAALFCRFADLAFGRRILIHYDGWFDELGFEVNRLEAALNEPLTQDYFEKEIYVDTPGETGEGVLREGYVCYIEDECSEFVQSHVVKKIIALQQKSIYQALLGIFGNADLLYLSLLHTQFEDECRNWIKEGMLLEWQNVS